MPPEPLLDPPIGRVVIVNDEPTQLKILSFLVENAGLHPLPFSSVAEALRSYGSAISSDIAHPIPQLIITDISMPGIDGWQFCRLLRSEEYRHLNEVPIIVVSATYAGPETERIARSLGVEAFLPVASERGVMLEAIRRVSGQSRSRNRDRALVFESDPSLGDACRRRLENEGYQVTVTTTLGATMATLAEWSPEVAVICVDHAEGHLEQIHTLMRRRPRSLWVFTSLAPTANQVIDWLNQGVAAYLKRPFSSHQLWETLTMLHRERGLVQIDAMVERQIQALRDSRERFQIVADYTADWETWISPRGEVLYTSPSCQQITGYSVEELVDDPGLLSRLVIAEDLPLYRNDEIERASLENLAIEFRIRRKDGAVRWIEHICRPVFGNNGVLRGRRVSNRDVTVHKEGEEALRRSRRELQAIYDHVPVMLAVVDQNRHVVFKNKAFNDFAAALQARGAKQSPACELFGCLALAEGGGVCAHRQQCLDCPARQAVDETLANGTMHADIEFLLNGSGDADGDNLVLSLSTSLLEDGRERRALLCLRDITEQKRAEQAVLQRERYFRNLFENAGDAIFIEDEEDRIVDANDKASSLLGYSKEELLRLSVPDLQTPSCRLPRGGAIRAELEIHGGRPFETIDIRKDGTLVPVEVTTVELFGGRDRRVLSIVRDITERKKVEGERDRLIRAIEQSGETIVITDPDGRIEYVNPTFERITGYSAEEVLGQNTSILKSGEHDPQFYRELWQTISSGRTWKGVMTNRKKDGSSFIEEVTISPVTDSRGKVVNYVAVKMDITEKRREAEEKEQLQNQYYQAQKMEAFGRMAGGMAHDFNNMLGVILGQVELAQTTIEKNHFLQEYLHNIHQATIRSAELTRQILTFARKQEVSKKHLDLNQAVRALMTMLRRLIGENIEIVWKPGGKLGTVFMDASQLDQILTNLCINARDAISGKGTITIETKVVNLDMAYCQTRIDAIPGEYIQLAIHDSGCGMSAETRLRIFEPFFTTKAAGAGTGLGLATTYGIVTQNRGSIEVLSKLGQGSSFLIYLPRHPPLVEDEAGEPVAAEIPFGTETILVVEDEAMILGMIDTMLRTLGYSVILSSDPQEAISLVRDHGQEIDLVLTDIVMPAMNGFELVHALQAILPELKYLYMSGYPDATAERADLLAMNRCFLQKPFAISVLAQKLRTMLDERF